MLLEIRHVTQYLYAVPVRESVMELWMQPQKSVHQRLISFELDVDPASQLFSYVDSFGNAVYHFDVPQPHGRLTINARSAVETQPPAPQPTALDVGEWDRLRSEFIRGENFDYLHPYGFATGSDALKKFELDHNIGDLRLRDPLTALRALNEAIFSAFEYETGVTRPDSPIEDALRAGKGVSQDFAHVMVAICRSWGVPARYASGYLFTDKKRGDRSDSDATHAWVEVFLPSLRWIGFDPTNNSPATERHVTCAVGRDYSDIPPSRGVYKGDVESELEVSVSVRRARAAISEPEFLRVSRPTPRTGPAPNRRAQPGSPAFQRQQRQQQTQK